MATTDNPFDRLGKQIKAIAEDAVDSFRAAYAPDRGRLMRDLRSLGFTNDEARRHVDLVVATTM